MAGDAAGAQFICRLEYVTFQKLLRDQTEDGSPGFSNCFCARCSRAVGGVRLRIKIWIELAMHDQKTVRKLVAVLRRNRGPGGCSYCVPIRARLALGSGF